MVEYAPASIELQDKALGAPARLYKFAQIELMESKTQSRKFFTKGRAATVHYNISALYNRVCAKMSRVVISKGYEVLDKTGERLYAVRVKGPRIVDGRIFIQGTKTGIQMIELL